MKPTIHKRFTRICIATLISFLLGLITIDSFAAKQETKKIFVLNSFNRGYPWTDNMLHGIDDAFANSGIKVDTYVSFMDMKRIPPTPQYFSKLKELIKDGYKGVRFDAVLACDNDALEFLRKYRDELFPKLPVVFSSINDFDERMLDGRKDITGTSENTDYEGTIRVALKLRPATKNIVVVIDNTTTGRAHRSAIEKIRQNFPQNLNFAYLSLADLTLDELAQQLSKLKSGSIVLLLQHFVDKSGIAYTVQQSTPMLTKSSSVPTFVLTDIRVGLGALGGHVVSGYHHGEAAAQMVVKILNGADISSIPVLMDSPNRYMFDYSAMQRFNISESDLPQGSIIVNEPDSLLHEYRPHISAIAIIFIVLCGMLVFLLVERKRRGKSEHKLRESEERYRVLFERANDGIFLLNADGFLDCNEKGASMYGVSREDVIGSSPNRFSPVMQPNGRLSSEVEAEKITEAFKGIPQRFEWQSIRSDGTPFDVEISLNKIDLGSTPLILALVRDISDRKAAETAASKAHRENLELQERLQRAEKMESLGTLAGGVAHDLNNVLGIIVGYAEMVLEGTDTSSPNRKSVENIMSGGLKAAAIVEDLLTLARRGVQGREILNLNHVVSDCRHSPELAKLLSQHPSVKIETNFEPDLLNISGSAVHLGKSLYNLISNASEAMPKGGTVTIRTANQYLDKPIHGYDQIQDGDYVVLSVSDNGEGIEEKNLKRIFEPFYTKKIMGRSGTGLGLAVVWGTVKDHNGYINVESDEGKGSTFTLYFPVSREAITAEAAIVAVSEYMGKGESILVVDDVKEQRDLATGILTNLNYNASSVSSGEEVVEYLKEHKADLIILDMIMDPGMDGLDTYKGILKINPKQQAIIVSGFSETDRVREAIRIGAGTYVKKPYIKEKLGLAVRKELDRKE